MKRTALAICALAAAALSCQSAGPAYEHSRYDYWSFRARSGRLPEPNYLPWAMHDEKLVGGARALVACRWPNDAFPLRYYVAPPLIPEDVQDEFSPRDPQEYVPSVERAFELWEQAIGRPVSFVRVDDSKQAHLIVHLEGAPLETEVGHVLGLVRDESGRCRVVARGDDPEHVKIEYGVSDVYLYVSDSVGLLTPHQVRAIALHEIGHVLGVSGQHSPLRGDVMFKIAADRRIDVLSLHDIHTLRALYSLPPGSVYARLDALHGTPIPEVRRGPPRLDRELSDERFDLRVTFPRGWQVIRSRRGWIAVDGLSWDYDASIQVIVGRGSVDPQRSLASLARLSTGAVQHSELIELDGQPVARVVSSAGERSEEIHLIGWDEGRVVFVIADCRSQDYQLYQPWFRSVLLSLQRGPDPQGADIRRSPAARER